MARCCPASTNLSLSNTLRSLFYSEYAPRFPTFSARPLNRFSLPRYSVRTFSTVPIASPPQSSSPKSSQSEHTTTADSLRASDESSNDQISTQVLTDIASSPQKEKKSKRFGERKEPDRNSKKVVQDEHVKIELPPKKKKKRELWQIQKEALQQKFPTGWSPIRKLSPDALEGIRHLNSVAPEKFTTAVLAEQFGISPEAIRRILKSKWRPSETEAENRRKRWEKRHDRIWSHFSELGLRPHTNQTEPVSDANAILYDRRDRKNKP